jgi:hypothetical protein
MSANDGGTASMPRPHPGRAETRVEAVGVGPGGVRGELHEGRAEVDGRLRGHPAHQRASDPGRPFGAGDADRLDQQPGAAASCHERSERDRRCAQCRDESEERDSSEVF